MKGRMKWIPSDVLNAIEGVKAREGVRSDSEALRILVNKSVKLPRHNKRDFRDIL